MQYISASTQKSLNQYYRMTLIVVLLFGISVLILMLVARFLDPSDSVPGSEKWSQPIYLGVIVVGLLVVILRRTLTSKMFLRSASAPSMVLRRLMNVAVVCCAIAESIAIAGLALYLLTADYQYSWRLGIVSLLLIVYNLPRRSEWERAVSSFPQVNSN